MTNERMQAAIKELEETAIVMTHLQARHAVMMKDHAEWLVSHDKAMIEAKERDKELSQRISDLVSGIGEFMSRTGK